MKGGFVTFGVEYHLTRRTMSPIWVRSGFDFRLQLRFLSTQTQENDQGSFDIHLNANPVFLHTLSYLCEYLCNPEEAKEAHSGQLFH